VKSASYDGVHRQTGPCLGTKYNVRILYGLAMIIMNVSRSLDKCNAFVYRQHVELCSSTPFLIHSVVQHAFKADIFLLFCSERKGGGEGTKQEKFKSTGRGGGKRTDCLRTC
jgi:hypothetical protein